MNTPTAPTMRRVTSRLRRGFTLLELVVVAAISSALLLILLQWVLTLGAASSATLDTASAQRAADLARDAFAADVTRAVPCAPGRYSPVRDISPEHVSFTVPRPGDPTVTDLVTWKISGTGDDVTLRRTVTAHTPASADPCAFEPAAGGKTYAEHLAAVATDQVLAGDPSARPAFFTIHDGHTVTDVATAWGGCGRTQHADRCAADGIGLNWVFHPPVDGAAPIVMTRTYIFTAPGGALS